MKTLVIDTCTNRIIVALADNSTIFSFCNEIIENQMSNVIMEKVENCFKEAGLKPTDVERVLVAVGPGSYTGVRIALTVAKMFSSFKEIPLYGVSSLYLAGSGYDNKNVAIMFDARRGNFFSSLYGENNIPDKLREKEEFLDSIKDFDDVKII